MPGPLFAEKDGASPSNKIVGISGNVFAELRAAGRLADAFFFAVAAVRVGLGLATTFGVGLGAGAVAFGLIVAGLAFESDFFFVATGTAAVFDTFFAADFFCGSFMVVFFTTGLAGRFPVFFFATGASAAFRTDAFFGAAGFAAAGARLATGGLALDLAGTDLVFKAGLFFAATGAAAVLDAFFAGDLFGATLTGDFFATGLAVGRVDGLAVFRFAAGTVGLAIFRVTAFFGAGDFTDAAAGFFPDAVFFFAATAFFAVGFGAAATGFFLAVAFLVVTRTDFIFGTFIKRG